MYDEDDYEPCDLCDPIDGSEPYPHPHCCLCGDTGYGDVPPCTCD